MIGIICCIILLFFAILCFICYGLDGNKEPRNIGFALCLGAVLYAFLGYITDDNTKCWRCGKSKIHICETK